MFKKLINWKVILLANELLGMCFTFLKTKQIVEIVGTNGKRKCV